MTKNNYCASGFDIKCTKDVTYNDYFELCAELTKRFKVRVGKDWSCEGGFSFYFEDHCLQYKVMRHRMCENGRGMLEFPNIALPFWEKNEDILWKSGTKGSTFLKAFHGAPMWKMDELLVFKEILTKNGITCSNMPTEDSINKPYRVSF